MSVKIRVWGDYACFSMPELKTERFSYDTITPSAAVGVLNSIHWKPCLRWVIDKIHVYKPVRKEYLFKNEVSEKINPQSVQTVMGGGALQSGDLYQNVLEERQQRGSFILRDVEYIIEAHFELTDKAGERDTQEKHFAIFMERAKKGQCFSQPFLGMREYPAYFELVNNIPPTPFIGRKDLGMMMYGIDYSNNKRTQFFHAVMQDGVIDVENARISNGY